MLSDIESQTIMGQAITLAAASLAVNDAQAIQGTGIARLQLVLTGSGGILGPRKNQCGNRFAQAVSNCSSLLNTPLYSVCLEDLCIPLPAASPVTFSEVAKRDLEVLTRTIENAKGLIASDVNLSTSLYASRLSSGAADDPSPVIEKVLGNEWWNICPAAKNLVALVSATS
jgi:hypothetical protein